MHLMQWRSRPSSSPFNFSVLQQEISRMFEHFSNLGQFGLGLNGGSSISPALDIKEDDKSVLVTAEIPGVDVKDVQVSVQDDSLVLKGEKRSERHEREDNYVCIERTFGSFERRVPLPNPVDPEHAEARMENGVLTLRLPKVDAAGTKTIPIKEVSAQGQTSGQWQQGQMSGQQQYGGGMSGQSGQSQFGQSGQSQPGHNGGQSGMGGQSQYGGQSGMGGQQSGQSSAGGMSGQTPGQGSRGPEMSGESYGETSGQRHGETSGQSRGSEKSEQSASEKSGGKSAQSSASEHKSGGSEKQGQPGQSGGSGEKSGQRHK